MSRRLWLFGFPILGMLIVGGGAAWTLVASEHPPGDPNDANQVSLGQAVYGRDCARCHGDDLSGEFGWLKKDNEGEFSDAEIERMLQSLDNVAPAHDSSGVTARHGDETLFSIIKDGPAVALAKPSSRMPGFSERLDDDEIWAIVAYLKNNWQIDDNKPG